jgi:hypothetical protein
MAPVFVLDAFPTISAAKLQEGTLADSLELRGSSHDTIKVIYVWIVS